MFVIKPNDSSPQHSKALSITRAKNVHLNSFTSLSTILTLGVSMKGNQYLENLLLSQNNTPNSKEMEMSFILVMFATTLTHT